MPEETPVQSGGTAVAEAPGSEPSSTATTIPTGREATTAPVEAPKEATKENARAVDAPSDKKEVDAPATPTAQVETPEENLSPEERSRREYQREKDLRYAAEQRALRAEEQIKRIEQDRQRAQAQQLTQQQQGYLNQMQQAISRSQSEYDDMYYRIQQLKQEGEDDQAEWLAQKALTLHQNIQWQVSELQQRAQYFQQQYGQVKAQEQEQAVDNILKDYGYTFKELTTFNPKLNKLDYFDVLKTAVAYERQQAETKAEAKYKAEIEKTRQVRERLDTEHPGSRVDSGQSATSNSLSIKVGNADAFLEKAFSRSK